MDRKILLIQSDVASAMVMMRALTAVGSGVRKVVWARTLAQGIEWLDLSVKGVEPTFCAVVCDLGLSDCSGVETFDRVFACGPLVPIFVVSVRALRDAATQTLQLGAQGSFLQECLEIRVLVDSIERSNDRTTRRRCSKRETAHKSRWKRSRTASSARTRTVSSPTATRWLRG